jgi:NTP pyrophosphatase (non-canonical NTP hydrolase)
MSQEFKDLQKEIHSLAQEKGWWIDDKISDKLLMIHSEVSEAVDCYRCGDMDDFPIELADIVIRVMDLAERNCIDLWEVINTKHEYNKTRSYRHGGKKI